MPRINTEFHGRKNKQKQNTEIRISRGRSICHGLTRNFTEKTEAEPRKQNTSFRAGCVSDGINILFGKGPFGNLRKKIDGGQK